MASVPTSIIHPNDVTYVAAGHSPLDADPYLFLDLSASHAVDPQLVARLAEVPVPVLGVGAPVAGGALVDALAEACDALVEPGDVEVIAARIRRAPLAAATFVQVLRATESLPVAAALTVESLAYSTLQAGPEFAAWLSGWVRRDVPVRDAGPAVLIDRTGADVEIRLNRPSRANAISVEMRDALVEAFELVALDTTIERVVVRGNGANFSTGGDLDEFGMAPDPATAHAIRTLRLPARALLPARDRVSFELHGACIGAGIELPAFGARVVARPDAIFHLPELDFGLIPGAGGCVSAPRRIGRQRTAWLVLTGRRIDASTALRWGLVDAIVS